MSTETNKAITRQLVDAINTDNEAAFLEVLVPDVVDHYSLPGLPPGREGWNMNRKILRAAFPDCYWQEEDLFAEGDRVVVRASPCTGDDSRSISSTAVGSKPGSANR